MSIQFTWEDRFSVNNPEIDGQHQSLFAIGNEMSEITDPEELKPLVMKLFKYTREHFSAEEEMMKQIDFPELKQHELLHEELIAKLNAVSAQPFSTEQAAEDFKELVYHWLVNHIMIEDSKYFQFSNEQS